jgi:hypothetical protein
MDNRSGLTGNPVLRRRVGRRRAKWLRAGEEALERPFQAFTWGSSATLYYYPSGDKWDPAAMHKLGGTAAVLKLPAQNYAPCVIYVLASFLLSFPFANTAKCNVADRAP